MFADEFRVRRRNRLRQVTHCHPVNAHRSLRVFNRECLPCLISLDVLLWRRSGYADRSTAWPEPLGWRALTDDGESSPSSVARMASIHPDHSCPSMVTGGGLGTIPVHLEESMPLQFCPAWSLESKHRSAQHHDSRSEDWQIKKRSARDVLDHIRQSKAFQHLSKLLNLSGSLTSILPLHVAAAFYIPLAVR